MKINVGFNFLWHLHQAESMANIDFLKYFDYSVFTEEWIQQRKDDMGEEAFNKEFPFGKESVEVIKHDNLTVVHFKNLPRQCGKSLLCRSFCKAFKHSVYLHPVGIKAKMNQRAWNITGKRCSRPRDLMADSMRGYRFDAICFDDFLSAEDSNLHNYLNVLKIFNPYDPCIVLVID
jgi:hypothetical protein